MFDLSRQQSEHLKQLLQSDQKILESIKARISELETYCRSLPSRKILFGHDDEVCSRIGYGANYLAQWTGGDSRTLQSTLTLKE